MTREEQRCKAAKEYAEKWYKELGTSVEEFPTDAQITIEEFTKGAEWADNHPNWHDADKELPPRDAKCVNKFSKKVLVSDGEQIQIGRYDYGMDGWLVMNMGVTHWMYSPEPPKEN